MSILYFYSESQQDLQGLGLSPECPRPTGSRLLLFIVFLLPVASSSGHVL